MSARKSTFNLSAVARRKLSQLKTDLEDACERFVSAKEIVEYLIDDATVKRLAAALGGKRKRRP